MLNILIRTQDTASDVAQKVIQVEEEIVLSGLIVNGKSHLPPPTLASTIPVLALSLG